MIQKRPFLIANWVLPAGFHYATSTDNRPRKIPLYQRYYIIKVGIHKQLFYIRKEK
jgi:hypothetical protein